MPEGTTIFCIIDLEPHAYLIECLDLINAPCFTCLERILQL